MTSYLRGKFATLRRAGHDDYSQLYEWALDPVMPWRWQGQAKTEETFTATVWAGTSDLFMILDSTLASVGYCSIYNLNLQHGTAYVLVGLTGKARSKGRYFEAASLVVNHAFETYRVRKIYIETTTKNLAKFSSITTKGFQEEGVLAGHLYSEGEFHDQHILSVTRSGWESSVDAPPRKKPDQLSNRPVLDSDVLELVASVLGPPWSELASADLGAIRLSSLDSLQILELFVAFDEWESFSLDELDIRPCETLQDLSLRVSPHLSKFKVT